MPWSFWAALFFSVFTVLDMKGAKKAAEEQNIAKTVYSTGMAIINTMLVVTLLQQTA